MPAKIPDPSVSRCADPTINASTGVISWTPVSAQAGTNSVTVRVTDMHGDYDTQTYNIFVMSSSGEQTPWATNGSGTTYTGYNWNYTMGYHFTPQADGRITKLGGYFGGAGGH